MGYVKIHDVMLMSSIMEEPVHIRWAWIAILLITNEDGLVYGTSVSLARRANVSLAEMDEALHLLTSPDSMSSSQKEDGRRLVSVSEKVWRVVNYGKWNHLGRQSIPRVTRQQILARDRGRCVVCGSRIDLQIDHIIPVSRGGDNEPSNLRVLCRNHNLSKGGKLDEEWGAVS